MEFQDRLKMLWIGVRQMDMQYFRTETLVIQLLICTVHLTDCKPLTLPSCSFFSSSTWLSLAASPCCRDLSFSWATTSSKAWAKVRKKRYSRQKYFMVGYLFQDLIQGPYQEMRSRRWMRWVRRMYVTVMALSGRQGLLLMLVFVCHSRPHQVQQTLIYSEVTVTLDSDTWNIWNYTRSDLKESASMWFVPFIHTVRIKKSNLGCIVISLGSHRLHLLP